MQWIRAPRPWREAWWVRQPNEPSQPHHLQSQPRSIKSQSVAQDSLSLKEQPPLLHLQPRPLHPARARVMCPQRAKPCLLLRPPRLASPLLSCPSGPQDLSEQQHAPWSPSWERVSSRSSWTHCQSPVLPACYGQSLWVLCWHHVTGDSAFKTHWAQNNSPAKPLSPFSLSSLPLTVSKFRM